MGSHPSEQKASDPNRDQQRLTEDVIEDIIRRREEREISELADQVAAELYRRRQPNAEARRPKLRTSVASDEDSRRFRPWMLWASAGVAVVLGAVLALVIFTGDDVVPSKEYNSPSAISREVVALGVTCRNYREDFSPANPLSGLPGRPYAISAGRCDSARPDGRSEELIFAIYESTQQRDAQVASLLGAPELPGIVDGVLIGKNWTVNCSEICEPVQSAIGGQIRHSLS